MQFKQLLCFFYTEWLLGSDYRANDVFYFLVFMCELILRKKTTESVNDLGLIHNTPEEFFPSFFKLEKFGNAGFSFSCGQKTISKWSFSKMMASR